MPTYCNLKRKIKNIIYLVLGIIILYSLLAIPISNYLSKRYGADLNNKRIELGIKPITENWTLDSIVLQTPVREMSCFPSEVLDTTDYKLLENKWYCQYWTNSKADTTKPYHKSKKIYFTKSFWLWKNEIDLEYDTFINPQSELSEYEELEVITHWWNNEIYGHIAHIKNGEDLLIDFDPNQPISGFEKSKLDKILTEWNLK